MLKSVVKTQQKQIENCIVRIKENEWKLLPSNLYEKSNDSKIIANMKIKLLVLLKILRVFYIILLLNIISENMDI